MNLAFRGVTERSSQRSSLVYPRLESEWRNIGRRRRV